MYEEIEKKYKTLCALYNNTLLSQYCHNELMGSIDDFNYDHWLTNTVYILQMKLEIFQYIPFTKEDVNIFIKTLKNKHPIYAFYAVTIFTDDQTQIFEYIINLLKNYKNIPLIFVLGGLNYALNEKARKKLVFDEMNKNKFFVPIKFFATINDIFTVLQIVNNYYKKINKHGNKELQEMFEYMYGITCALQKQKLLTNKIKYELLKLKKKLFMECLTFNEHGLLPTSYTKMVLKQIIIDYYFIFHRKRNKNFIFKQINKWILCQCHYDSSTKKEIQYILENIQRISFKKLNLLFNQIKFIKINLFVY